MNGPLIECVKVYKSKVKKFCEPEDYVLVFEPPVNYVDNIHSTIFSWFGEKNNVVCTAKLVLHVPKLTKKLSFGRIIKHQTDILLLNDPNEESLEFVGTMYYGTKLDIIEFIKKLIIADTGCKLSRSLVKSVLEYYGESDIN